MRKHLSMRRRNNKKKSLSKRAFKKTKRKYRKRKYRKRKTRRKRGGNAGDVGDATTSNSDQKKAGFHDSANRIREAIENSGPRIH